MPLFTVETDRLRLVWRGPEAPPDPTAPPGRLRVRPFRTDAALRVTVRGEPVGDGAPLRLAEQTAYRLFVEARGAVEVRHADPALVGALTPERDGRVVFGAVDFRGEVGGSTFTVAVDGQEEVAVAVEVFPTKAAFAEVEAMRAEVDEALAGLALEYLRATASPVGPAPDPPRRAAWLTLVRRALPPLEAALTEVARRPLRVLRREPVLHRAEAVRRADAAVRRAVRTGRGSGEPAWLDAGTPVRAVLPAAPARATLDTPEHRWLRVRLDAARRTLAALDRAEAALPQSPRRQATRADLADASLRAGRLLRLPPLRAADARSAPAAPTERLLRAPGYAEAHAALRRLDLGLALAGGPVPHATKDLPMLYEVWTYLTVVRMVAGLLGVEVPPASFFRGEHRGVRLLLRRGRRHAVRLEGDGLTVGVAYNPRFGARHGLLAQRPDLLLTVERPGVPPRHLILDAKYRRDDGPGYARRFGAPGPPEDALGALHRYRDAIVEREGQRSVEAAAALYPYRPDAIFEETRLWRALEGIGVGAIPLLPGETGWLERWLRAVLIGGA